MLTSTTCVDVVALQTCVDVRRASQLRCLKQDKTQQVIPGMGLQLDSSKGANCICAATPQPNVTNTLAVQLAAHFFNAVHVIDEVTHLKPDVVPNPNPQTRSGDFLKFCFSDTCVVTTDAQCNLVGNKCNLYTELALIMGRRVKTATAKTKSPIKLSPRVLWCSNAFIEVHVNLCGVL